MPGKHAPESPWSFAISVARAGAGALAVLGVVILIAWVAVSRTDGQQAADGGGPTPTPAGTAEPTPTDGPDQEPAASPSPTPRPPGEVRVRVLNGNGATGLAGEVSDELAAAGYEVLEPGNHQIVGQTIIYFRAGARVDARELRRTHFSHVPASQIRRAPGGVPPGMVVVVLGRDHPTG